jgi:uncharacterized protein with HEPN domain
MQSMPSERVRQRLFDIRENIGLAREFIRGLAFDEFAADVKTFYATVRALEIVSEAARFLPDDLKARHEDVDWVAVRDAGNVYRHAYELVTEERIWDTVTKRLDPVERAIAAELRRFG